MPGHCNIKGNEEAYKAARNAIKSPNSDNIIPLYSSLVDNRHTKKYKQILHGSVKHKMAHSHGK